MPDEMRPWQHGYPLDDLKRIRQLFDRYEPYSFGRFSIPNESQIALMLADKTGYLLVDSTGIPGGFMAAKIAKRNSVRKDFAGRSLVIREGDFQIQHLTYEDGVSQDIIESHLLQFAGNRSIWADIHAEDRPRIRLLERLGFQVVAGRVSASSEIYSILLRSNRPAMRLPGPMHPSHRASLEELSPAFITSQEIADICQQIESGVSWADHYSSYNMRHSWSAISLRGFSDDPAFIVKPAEMSKKWKEQNPELLDAEVRDTVVMAQFPTIVGICQRLGTRLQRVRLMRVRAGDGALSRHADITDREAGPMPGQIARLHIPIVSDPSCRFMSWDLSGEMRSRHLNEGSLWYLDTRKPHAVSNEGSPRDRIHLVIDAVCDETVTGAIAASLRQ